MQRSSSASPSSQSHPSPTSSRSSASSTSLWLRGSVVNHPGFLTTDHSDGTDGSSQRDTGSLVFFRVIRDFRGPASVSSVSSC